MAHATKYKNNHTNYEFNYNLHNLSLIRVMISSGLLRWKLEMHMVIKNTLYPSILSPTIPYPYLFCVGEGEEASTSACFPRHPEMPQAIKLKSL